MDLQGALLAAVSALAAALGVLWVALQKQITEAKQGCEDDRKRLWELVQIVSQLDRRRRALADRTPLTDDEIYDGPERRS